jgi:M6 family metalloprotease-like protein
MIARACGARLFDARGGLMIDMGWQPRTDSASAGIRIAVSWLPLVLLVLAVANAARTDDQASQPARGSEPDFAGVIGSKKLAATEGPRKVLAILWDPRREDHPAPPLEEIDRLLFGKRPSLQDWFQENSSGKLRIERAGVLGWFKSRMPAENYWGTSSSKDPHDRDGDGWLNGHVRKWTEAIEMADASFDFAEFDANNDKLLEPHELGLLIVIPQRNPFGTNRPPAAREAPRWQPLVVDGARIPMIAEWDTGLPVNLGAPAHELCHLLLGSPDLYVGRGWPYSPGLFSIMDYSYSSAHLDAFQKLKLGWVDYEATATGRDFTLPDVETQGKVLIVYDERRGPGEYFLLENRWRGGSYDAGAGSAGADCLPTAWRSGTFWKIPS